MSSIEVTPRASASLRSRACWLASASTVLSPVAAAAVWTMSWLLRIADQWRADSSYFMFITV